MFALWLGDQLNFSIFKSTTFGFRGQHAASEAGHIANTNVGGNISYDDWTTENIFDNGAL